MKAEERHKASIDLTRQYLNSYYPDWRLTKVLTIQKLLLSKYEFYKDIAQEVRQCDDENGSATIAQEIKNGLYFDAIAQCVQYIEDLFALIKASKNPDYFIKNIVTYNAGQITTSIKNFKSSDNNIAESFHFPYNLTFSKENQIIYENGVKYLITLVNDLVNFYNTHEFFYTQYKHGLAIPMRPLLHLYSEETIQKEKLGELKPYLAVYDNLNLKAASKKGTFFPNNAVLMPGFTENVRPFISELSAENNYLRFVFPDKNLSIEMLVDIARKTRASVQSFIVNYLREIENIYEFQLPLDHTKNTYNVYSYKKDSK